MDHDGIAILKDAKILAEWILDEWWWNDNGDYGDQMYHCKYCNGKSWGIDLKNPRTMLHENDCPILVALDILTEV
jgi:hypothetical protein